MNNSKNYIFRNKKLHYNAVFYYYQLEQPIVGKNMPYFAQQMQNIVSRMRSPESAQELDNLIARTKNFIANTLYPLEKRKVGSILYVLFISENNIIYSFILIFLIST